MMAEQSRAFFIFLRFFCFVLIRTGITNEPYRHKHDLTAPSCVLLYQDEQSGSQRDKVSSLPNVTLLKKARLRVPLCFRFSSPLKDFYYKMCVK